jgi:hypothetical protein
MGVVGRLDQYASTLAWEFDETTANTPRITGLGTYYASEFNENVGEPSVFVEYLVVGGGGGGGNNGGGGGGAGGFLTGTLTLTPGAYSITVGTGGTPGTPFPAALRGNQGGSSIFSTITAAGGGGGGSPDDLPG